MTETLEMILSDESPEAAPNAGSSYSSNAGNSEATRCAAGKGGRRNRSVEKDDGRNRHKSTPTPRWPTTRPC